MIFRFSPTWVRLAHSKRIQCPRSSFDALTSIRSKLHAIYFLIIGRRGRTAMNKAYSNKALPMGTVLREWRHRGSPRRRRLRHRLQGARHLFRRARRDQGIFPELDQRARFRRHGRADRFRRGGGPRARPQEVRRGSQAAVEPVDADAATPTSSASAASSRSTAPPTWSWTSRTACRCRGC